jgi:hypothetical protein
VLGVDGWQDDYQCLPDGSVVCRLRCRIGGEWLVRVDVGSPSERPDGGDLNQLASQHVAYDPQRKPARGPGGWSRVRERL